DELEPTERSVYTGAIGYFAPGGRMTLNIAIRTMIQAGGRLHWYTGGGIVADSVPAAEYDETCAKALGMRRALGLAESEQAARLSVDHPAGEPIRCRKGP
ncbi:MAG: chorismate-binding protein, partial [Planctomycetes bacterium]|nr:chorismate-binding protein [Planctomycetota bacterium]